jgi:hypothetical protein
MGDWSYSIHGTGAVPLARLNFCDLAAGMETAAGNRTTPFLFFLETTGPAAQ